MGEVLTWRSATAAPVIVTPAALISPTTIVPMIIAPVATVLPPFVAPTMSRRRPDEIDGWWWSAVHAGMATVAIAIIVVRDGRTEQGAQEAADDRAIAAIDRMTDGGPCTAQDQRGGQFIVVGQGMRRAKSKSGGEEGCEIASLHDGLLLVCHAHRLDRRGHIGVSVQCASVTVCYNRPVRWVSVEQIDWAAVWGGWGGPPGRVASLRRLSGPPIPQTQRIGHHRY